MAKYKIGEQLTFSTLKVEVGKPLHVTILGIETKPDIDAKTGKVKKEDDGTEKTIDIVQVFNLDDEKKYEMVGGKVLVEEMKKASIKAGDSLQIIKVDKAEGKKYYTYELHRLELTK